MLLEVITPYDREDLADIYTSYRALFARLSEMCEEEGFGQTEIEVLKWESWAEREALLADPDFDCATRVVLEVDRLTD